MQLPSFSPRYEIDRAEPDLRADLEEVDRAEGDGQPRQLAAGEVLLVHDG